MPAPSPLSIATSSVQRLLKEETYYHKELSSQQARIEKLEKALSERSAGEAASEDHENDEFVLKQEVCDRPLSSPLSLLQSISFIYYSTPLCCLSCTRTEKTLG